MLKKRRKVFTDRECSSNIIGDSPDSYFPLLPTQSYSVSLPFQQFPNFNSQKKVHDYLNQPYSDFYLQIKEKPNITKQNYIEPM